MAHIKTTLALAGGLALVCAGGATATWAELGDAPDGPFVSQSTMGAGALTSITGVLDRPGGDHVDTYAIIITDPALFYATTLNFYGGSAVNQGLANEDTRLWLWSAAGSIVLGNDDVNALGGNTLGSLISDPSTYPALSGGEVVDPSAAGVSLVAGQTYLLSISEFANDPEDAANVDLVNLGSDFDALHGAAAAGPFDHWENAADTDVITYDIRLEGATFAVVPAPGAAGLLVGALLLGRRRRR